MRDPGDVPPSFLMRAMSWAQGGTPRSVAPADAARSGGVTVDVGLARDGALKHDTDKSLSVAGDGVEGLDIAFDRLTFTVPGRRGSAGIQILRDACGFASAGRLTAMQGPSGAGKVSGMERRGEVFFDAPLALCAPMRRAVVGGPRARRTLLLRRYRASLTA